MSKKKAQEWFEFLFQQQIPFIIRVKECYVAEESSDKRKGLGRKQILNRCVILWGKVTLRVH